MPEYEDHLVRAEKEFASAQILIDNEKSNIRKSTKGALALLGLDFVNKGCIEEIYCQNK